jgi:hypothetical protein
MFTDEYIGPISMLFITFMLFDIFPPPGGGFGGGGGGANGPVWELSTRSLIPIVRPRRVIFCKSGLELRPLSTATPCCR